MPRIERFFANQKVPDWTGRSLGAAGPTAKANGGTESTIPGGITQHVYTSSGGFFIPADSPLTSVDMFVVGGGGSGGLSYSPNYGGGGGAGGYRAFTSVPVVAGTNYACVLGGGAVSVFSPTMADNPGPSRLGTPSYFSDPANPLATYEANGGGGGGGRSNVDAQDGGSGGGNRWPNPTTITGTGNTPPTTPSQGYPGGAGYPGTYAGGGGGAGEAGKWGGAYSAPYTPDGLWRGGYGGAGAFIPYYGYVGGGGGGATNSVWPSPYGPGSGGSGGGGPGGPSTSLPGTPGTANSGGGGGGGPTGYAVTTVGGNGGSGLIIIRYPT